MYVINAVLSRLVFGDQILLVKEVCTTCSKELRNVKDCLCSANYSEITLDVRNYFQKSKKVERTASGVTIVCRSYCACLLPSDAWILVHL